MREILFRGKSEEDGEWLYGLPDDEHHNADFPCILPDWRIHSVNDVPGSWEVDPETVGQYTGLTDKNGKKIFEGDIVTIPGSKRQGLPATVEYFPQGAVFQIRRVGYNAITLWDANESVEVIGNVHDNPELLRGE